MPLAGAKDVTTFGNTYREWNADLCECHAENHLSVTADTITVPDPINTQFTTLSKDYAGGDIVFIASIHGINVGADLTVGSDAPQKIVSIGANNEITLQGALSKPYPKGTTVSAPQVFAQVRVYTNLPYGAFVTVQRNNDNRHFYKYFYRVGADHSIVTRLDIVQFGSTMTYGNPDLAKQQTQTVNIVPTAIMAPTYKACFTIPNSIPNLSPCA